LSFGSAKMQQLRGGGINMAKSMLIELQMPGDLARFKLPAGVQTRLQELLDRQDRGQPLTDAERSEAEGLVSLAELLSLLRLRAERAAG
jgi:hypothetical protein